MRANLYSQENTCGNPWNTFILGYTMINLLQKILPSTKANISGRNISSPKVMHGFTTTAACETKFETKIIYY